MRTIPIDPNLRTIAAGPATPATTDTGEQRLDKEGRPLFNLPVIAVTADGTAEPLTVRVVGPEATVPLLTPIRLPGLVARPWTMNGRSGVSFSATKVEVLSKQESA